MDKKKKYNFNTMLIELSLNPNKTFSSESAEMYEQNLNSVIHWLTGPGSSIPRMVLAKDWTEDNG